MNIQEKRKAFEKLLAGAPEVMSPLQVSKWTPYGRNTIYAMLRSGELPSIQYRGTYLISKRKCSWMLQNGHIPCIDTGKKTRRYTILRKDVLRCARSIDTIEFPQMFSSVKESRKKPNLTAEQCDAYMSHLLAKWRTKPSVLTVRAVSELLSCRRQTVARWIAKGNLKSASIHGEPIIAQPWLADFCCHYGYHIVKKSERHRKLEESFFKPSKE